MTVAEKWMLENKSFDITFTSLKPKCQLQVELDKVFFCLWEKLFLLKVVLVLNRNIYSNINIVEHG